MAPGCSGSRQIEEAARQLGEVMAIVMECLATVGVRVVPALLALIDVPPGKEPVIAAVQACVNDAMSTFQDFNESGKLAERLAPEPQEAKK